MLSIIWCLLTVVGYDGPICCGMAKFDASGPGRKPRIVFFRGADWGAFDPRAVKPMVRVEGDPFNRRLMAVDLFVPGDAVVILYPFDAKARRAAGEAIGFGSAILLGAKSSASLT